MGRRKVAGLLLVWGVFAGSDPVLASSFKLVDDNGVVHFTNAPTDPRYRRFDGWTGAAFEWPQLPEGRLSPYATEIREAASRYEIAPGLVEAVIWVESTFDPWAVSRKGAQGLMQLMPRTASSLGVRDVFNPRQNIDGGVRHLRTLLDRYNGSLPLALAAYNAGDEAVRRYGGVPPYPETQHYVRKILELLSGPTLDPAQEAIPELPGSSSLQLDSSQFIYRYEDSRGSVTYTNIPPTMRPQRK